MVLGYNPPITPENASQVEVLHRLQIVGSYATELAFNPTVPSQLAVAQSDGFVSLWDAATGQQITSWQAAEGAVSTLAFTTDGQNLITGGNDGTLTAWDVANQQSVWSIQSEEYAPVVLDTAANNIVAVGYTDGIVRVWNTHTGEHLFTIYGHDSPMVALDLSSSGSDLVMGYQRIVLLYRLEDINEERIYLGYVIPVEELGDVAFHPNPQIAFFPDSTVLLIVENFTAPRIWHLSASVLLVSVSEAGTLIGYPYHVAFSGDGSMFALVGGEPRGGGCDEADCPIQLIAVHSDEDAGYSSGDTLGVLPIAYPTYPIDRVSDIAFNSDDRFFAAITLAGNLTIWGIPSSG
jgi:WD40 repeat protein